MDITANARLEFIPSALCAALITTLLLFLMCSLIDSNITPPNASNTRPFPDIVGYTDEIETIVEQKIIKPEEAQPTPEVPELQRIELAHGDSDVSIKNTYTPDTGIDHTPSLGSSGLIQQVMIAPSYPNRALTRGLEGFVDVRFAVTAIGVTTDIEILRAEPEGVFDRAAVRAVKRWKYLPNEERKGVLPVVVERIRFSLEQ